MLYPLGKNWLEQMRPLALSLGLGTVNPKTLSSQHTKLPIRYQSCKRSVEISNPTQKPSSPDPILLQEQLNKIEPSNFLVGRREACAVGFGFCFGGVLGAQTEPCAAAETSAACELTLAPSGLAFCDKLVGYGPEASKGQLIKAHYVGRLENGTVFDSSYNRGKPLTFRVGVGEVIKGWDQGILGGEGIPPMLAGGKRILKLPPELGYGVRGAGCKGGSCIIPPNSILVFDVEFIGKA